jgi:tetratricopeptide (TPR) repeat protein
MADSSRESRGGQRTFPKTLLLGLFGLILIQKIVVVWQIRLAPSVDPWSGLDTTAYVELAQRVMAGDWGLGPGLYYVSPFYIYFLAIALKLTGSYTAVRLIQELMGTIAIWFMFETTRVWFNDRAAWATAILAGATGLFTFYEALILQTGIDTFFTAAALLTLTYALRPPAIPVTPHRKDPAPTPGRNAGRTPGRNSGPNPGRNPGPNPGRDSGRTPGRDPGRDSGRTPGRNPGPWTERWTPGHWLVATGVIFGLQTLNRPNILVAVVGLVALMAVMRRWRFAVMLSVGLLIGIAPAAARNVIVSHKFSLLSSHGGLNFYIGNGEGATGYYRFIEGITPTIKGQANDARRVASRALGHEVDDGAASDYFMNLALSWITAHPVGATILMGFKFLWVFHAQHVPLPYSYPFYQYDWPTWLRYNVIGPWLLVPFGLVGLWFARPKERGQNYFLWAAFVPAYAAAVALFFLSERYRLPLLAPLAIGSGATVDLIITRVSRADWRALVAPLSVAAVLLVLVNTRGLANAGRWDEGLRLASQLAIQGRFDEMDTWVAKLEATTTHPGSAFSTVGLQLLLKNQPARALTYLEKASALDPNKAGTEYALGQALLGVGRSAEAIPHLQFGLEHGATMPLAGYHLAAALRDAGRTDEAIALLPKIKMTDESSVEDWLTVGRLGMELKAADAAAPFFLKATTMAPARADAHLQFGVCLVVIERFADAASELTEAVRLDPKNAAGLAYLAYAELQLGRLDQARTHLAAALALDPNDPMARQLVGTIK